jgi:FKBP-type peptidyl-prolyl cis-trans isomerase SlyD
MQDGDFIEIEYIGKIKESGEIFDLTSEEIAKKEGIYNKDAKYGPVKIIIGENFVIKGLEEELKKMKVGEEKTVIIPPEKAFGNRDPKLIKVVPEAEFRKQKVTPIPGLIIDFGNLKARIQSVSSGRVRLDFNHPLAGRELEYKVKILRKIEDKEEKIKTILEFFGVEENNFKILENKVEIEEKKSINDKIKEKIAELIKKYLKVEKVDFIKSF